MSGNEKIEYKLILLGNSAVGKTSLFKKITTGEFYEKNISTIGMDRRTIQLDLEVKEKGVPITRSFDIALVDTAGQERFKSITKTYYKESDGILLIYDVTNRESFEQLKIWIDSIYDSLGHSDNSKYLIILIGNKIDLIGEDGKVREVKEEEAETKCNENKMLWGGECSAKTFSDTELLDLIKKYVLEVYKKVGPKIVNQQIVKKIAEKKPQKRRKCIFL